MKTILVTGAAGFIGMHTAKKLLAQGYSVVGVDNLNPYYDVALKYARLNILQRKPQFSFHQLDINDIDSLKLSTPVNAIIHLAAQAGVRYSIEHPEEYIQSNVNGTFRMLEFAKKHKINRFVYASSSSVYGENFADFFVEDQPTLNPKSIYAATKIATEALCQSYHNIFDIATCGLRFFTVYGSWGRPDMAPILFADAMTQNKPIRLFNNGQMWRDFTHVSDISDGIIRATKSNATGVYNLGAHKPTELMTFVKMLEEHLHTTAICQNASMQPGDVVRTSADIGKAQRDFGYEPKMSLELGVSEFCTWYLNKYKKNILK